MLLGKKITCFQNYYQHAKSLIVDENNISSWTNFNTQVAVSWGTAINFNILQGYLSWTYDFFTEKSLLSIDSLSFEISLQGI